jgi:hypothetical protein
MIIDTESEEGKALVALAKFGKWALDSSREDLGDLDGGEIQDKAEALGLLCGAWCDGTCGSAFCDNDDEQMCYTFTKLAKLPDGL